MWQTSGPFSRRLAPTVQGLAAALSRAAKKACDPLGRPFVWRGRQWNPLRVDAFFWGRRDPRFRQGLGMATAVHLLVFLLAGLSFAILRGCEDYLLPAGGGSNQLSGKRIIVTKKVPKQKRMRYAVNPLNPIKFEVAEYEKMIDQVLDKTFVEEMRHRYAVGTEGTGQAEGNLGYGKGTGAGYGPGHEGGMIRFIRLKYAGGDWDSNMGKGADYNLLLEYRIRTGQKVAHETEFRTIAQLDGFRMYRSPPFVYMTGSGRMDISEREVQILRRYLLEKHGMILADCAAPRWGSEFRRLMGRVLPEVRPVVIPIDDDIFRAPYRLSKVPYAAPHDGKDAIGWKVQGRWVVIYHPGDLGDAWKDGHSGIPREAWEACYELAINIIHYAHSRYAQWIMETKGDKQ